MTRFYPARIGSGGKVHAAEIVGHEQRGRWQQPVLRALCSSGRSSLAHSFRSPAVKAVTEGTPITCRTCRELLFSAVPEGQVTYVITFPSGETLQTANVYAATQTWELFPGSVLHKFVASDDPVLRDIYRYEDGGWTPA